MENNTAPSNNITNIAPQKTTGPINISALNANNNLLNNITKHWFSNLKKQAAINNLLEFFPLQVFDENEIETCYQQVASAYNKEKVQFAIKANPTVLPILHNLGCKFEVASAGEIEFCLQNDVDISEVLYTNPSRSWLENKFALKAGITRFVCHDQAGFHSLQKGIELAQKESEENNLMPNEKAYVAPDFIPEILLRIYVDNTGLDATGQGITRLRFGRSKENALKLLLLAHTPKLQGGMGYNANGVSFHVGSDEKNPIAWKNPINDAAWIFSEFYKKTGKKLEEVDIGGGMPFQREGIKTHAEFAIAIRQYFKDAFNKYNLESPTISLEPGRALASSAGLIFTRIIDVIERKTKDTSGNDITLNVITENGGRINAGIVPFGYDAYAFTFAPEKGFIDCKKSTNKTARTFGETCTDFDCSGEFTLPNSVNCGDNLVFLGTGVYVDSFRSDLCSFEPPFIVRVNYGDPFPSFNILAKLLSDHLLPLKEKHHLLEKEVHDLIQQFHNAC